MRPDLHRRQETGRPLAEGVLGSPVQASRAGLFDVARVLRDGVGTLRVPLHDLVSLRPPSPWIGLAFAVVGVLTVATVGLAARPAAGAHRPATTRGDQAGRCPNRPRMP